MPEHSPANLLPHALASVCLSGRGLVRETSYDAYVIHAASDVAGHSLPNNSGLVSTVSVRTTTASVAAGIGEGDLSALVGSLDSNHSLSVLIDGIAPASGSSRIPRTSFGSVDFCSLPRLHHTRANGSYQLIGIGT